MYCSCPYLAALRDGGREFGPSAHPPMTDDRRTGRGRTVVAAVYCKYRDFHLFFFFWCRRFASSIECQLLRGYCRCFLPPGTNKPECTWANRPSHYNVQSILFWLRVRALSIHFSSTEGSSVSWDLDHNVGEIQVKEIK